MVNGELIFSSFSSRISYGKVTIELAYKMPYARVFRVPQAEVQLFEHGSL